MSREPLRAAARLAERNAVAARLAASKAAGAAGRPAVEAANPVPVAVSPPPPDDGVEDELEEARAEIWALRRMLFAYVTRYRVSPEQVHYRPGSEAKRCGNCVMFHDRSCDLVRGLIDPDAVCDRWLAVTHVIDGRAGA